MSQRSKAKKEAGQNLKKEGVINKAEVFIKQGGLGSLYLKNNISGITGVYPRFFYKQLRVLSRTQVA